jgi:hypothetical protein
MSQSTKSQYNRYQNDPDFRLEPIKNQTPLFKNQLLLKTLNPIQEDPNNPRTCTVQCLVKGYK